MRTITDQHLYRLKIIYGFALGIIAITILSSYGIMRYSIHESRDDSRIINLSGRERMLSQRVTKCALALEHAGNHQEKTKYINEISESLSSFRKAFDGLQNGNEELGISSIDNSQTIKELFREATPYFNSIVTSVESIISLSNQENLPKSQIAEIIRVILKNESEFLPIMDKITFQFDKESKERVLYLEKIELFIMIVGILVLLAEFIFVFRPSASRIAQMISSLKKQSEELNKSNISLRESKEESLRLMEAANAANIAKSEFLTNMSHEIRTPLNSVIGFAEILNSTPLNIIQEQYVQNINTSAYALLGIINDILDLSKIEAGKLDLDCIGSDLIKAVNESADVIKYHTFKKGIKLNIFIQSGTQQYAVFDPVRLKQILINLLGNAVKFTEKGEIEFKVEYHKISDTSGRFTFSVRDTGIGISEDQKDRLFKAFSQADTSTTRKFGGTGLGLVISNLLASKMGSCIEFSSTSGQGSTFYFTAEFELADAEECCKEDRKKETANLRIPDKKYTILVAEDTMLNMMVTKIILGQLIPSAVIIEAKNGLTAVKLAMEKQPDLILMDIQMPEMDGIEATTLIRKSESGTQKHLPIIALTADALKEEKEACFKKAGMDAFLTKPIQKNALIDAINTLLS